MVLKSIHIKKIGEILQVSSERIGQIEKRAIEKLRKLIESKNSEAL